MPGSCSFYITKQTQIQTSHRSSSMAFLIYRIQKAGRKMLTEVRCPVCHAKLCNVDNGYVEIKCRKCKNLISYDGATNITRNKGSREYTPSQDYQSMKSRVTSSGHRFQD